MSTQDAAFYRAGAGEPLVLLHGATLTWRSWLPILDELSAVHDVYAPTLPGHFGGPPLTGRQDIHDLVDRVEQMLDEQGIRRAHLVGNSLGGWVALELLRRGRALSVVGLSPAGAWPQRMASRRAVALIRAIIRLAMVPVPTFGLLRHPEVRKLVFSHPMLHGDRIPTEEAEAMVQAQRRCAMLLTFLSTLPTNGQCAPVDSGQVPVRIAWSRQDRVIPYRTFGVPLIERIPSAELVMLDGTGHVPMYDDPDLVVRTILDVTGAAGLQADAG